MEECGCVTYINTCITMQIKGKKLFRNIFKEAEFKVLTEVVMNTSVFLDITPCTPLCVKLRFREHVASIFSIE
jgi:hypothetical protein